MPANMHIFHETGIYGIYGKYGGKYGIVIKYVLFNNSKEVPDWIFLLHHDD